MKTRALLVTTLLALLPTALLSAEEAKVPNIEVLERLQDAGEVIKGEKINYEFKVKNSGNAPLQIYNVRPSCGCTVASFDKTIMPGEIGKIKAVIDSNRLSGGRTAKTVTVKSNDPDESQIVLQLKATVLSLVTVTPPTVYIRTDRIKLEGVEMKVTPNEANPLEVTGVTSDVPYLKFKVEKGETTTYPPSKPGGQLRRVTDYTIKISIDKTAPTGDLNGTLTIATSSTKTPSVPIPIRGTISGLIDAVPRRVYFRLRGNQVFVTPTGDTVMVRRRPDMNSPEIGEARKGERLEVVAKAANVDPDDNWRRVRLPNRRIGYISAEFVEEVKADAQQTQVNNSRTIHVRKKEGNPFQVTGTTCDINGVKLETAMAEEGRAYTITVTYDGPIMPGTRQGEIIVKTDDKDEPELKIPIFVQVT